MTNSTPKSNKIERQGSPNGKKWTPQQRKSVTYFASSMTTSTTTSKEVTATMTIPVAQQQQQQLQQQQQTTPANKKQNPAVNRQSCSPSNNRSVQPMPRFSPLRHDSPRGSPTNNFYAGAKFSEPPSPAMLPKPPSHWTGLMIQHHHHRQQISCGQQSARMMMLPCNITQHFSKLINVQA